MSARVYNSSLSIPGRQPCEEVRVNWQHPLSRGLVAAWIPNKPIVQNLANPALGTGVLGDNIYAGLRPNKAGVGAYSSSTSYRGMEFVGSNAIKPTRFTVFTQFCATSNTTEGLVGNRVGGDGFNWYNAGTGWLTHGAGIDGVWQETILWVNYGGEALLNMASTYDGTSLIGYTNGNNGSVKAIAGDATWPVSQDWGTGRPSNNLLMIYDRALSQAEVSFLSRDPYCIFEPVSPMRIGVTVSGGGTVYNESLALGIAAATGGGAGLGVAGAMTLGMAAGVSEAGNMSAITALALGLQAGLSDHATNALASSNLALGLGLAISSASIDQMSGALSLSVVAGAGVNGGQDFTVNIPLGLIAGLQTSGGKSYGESLSLGLALGQAVATAIGSYVPALSRILPVQADNRLLNIRIENRRLVIAVENRTINVKLE